MADSIRQKIVDAVEARLETILTSGGYETDIGQNVFVWRDTDRVPFKSDELPALVIFDKQCEHTEEGEVLSRHRFRLTMIVDVFADSSTGDTFVRKAISDLHKAIGVDQQWTVSGTKLALITRPVMDQIDIEQKEEIISAARFAFMIEFRTNRWDPYNQ